MQTTIIIFLILLVLVWTGWSGGRMPEPFRSKACQGRNWKKAFPDAAKADIRKFLSLFVLAFAIHEAERLKLSPEDYIQDIYKVLNPHGWQADAMEWETLAVDVERTYGVDLRKHRNRELTLGELFKACLESKSEVVLNKSLDLN